MDKRKILVTGIGGNVAQGIIRNTRSAYPDIFIVGSNTAAFSAGNHLCDSFYTVPYAYDEGYINAIQNIVDKEHIELVIPATDYEVFYLANNRDKINAVIAVSGAATAKTYLDKYLSYRHHTQYGIPFAETCLPSAYRGQFRNFIAKPRKGRGSRGLHINPPDTSVFHDEEYLVQEMHEGDEITTSFYVTKDNTLHGHITLLRDLEFGTTAQCKVTFDHDKAVEPILKAMIRHGDIKGSANLQSIVTKSGAIIPFEVNCRISGTNSIRSNFGFKDVAYTIQEYLFNKKPAPPEIIPGVAVRILMDVIYTNKEDYGQCLDKGSGFYIF
jgi:carbamoyl-phosphate synthase large subunit